MSDIKFATTCDRCPKISEEYTRWPVCRECGDDVCNTCIVAGSLDDESGRAICIRCLQVNIMIPPANTLHMSLTDTSAI
jgi:hypothetical protein